MASTSNILNEKNILKYSDMPGQKENFAHIKELVEDKDINPIKEFFVESGLGSTYQSVF